MGTMGVSRVFRIPGQGQPQITSFTVTGLSGLGLKGKTRGKWVVKPVIKAPEKRGNALDMSRCFRMLKTVMKKVYQLISSIIIRMCSGLSSVNQSSNG